MAINFDHQRDRISSSSGSITVNTTGSLAIPVGNTAQRPAVLSTGQIRFNSQQSAFEGYNGVGWSTLGGVRDVDGNTYVIAETGPGVDNNELDFFTDGVQYLQIGATGNFTYGVDLNKFTIDSTSGDVNTAGTSTTVGNTFANSNLTVGIDLAVTGDSLLTGTLGVTGISTLGVLGAGETTLSSATISDLTATRVVLAGTAGAIEDSANFTFDGTDLTVTGSIGVSVEATLASAIVSDLTDNRIVIAGTAGAIEDSANLTFDGTLLNLTGDFDVSGNVNIGGNITIGDANTDAITVTADFDSHLIPDTDITYDLGATTKNWRAAYVQTIYSDTNILTISSTGAIVLPVGTVADRPVAPAQGMMRYNSDDTTFEGYDGTAWGSLGGVKDVDQDTYISAETTPGDDNDELNFYTAGVARMAIGDTGQITAAATYTPIAAQDLLTKTYAENSLVVTAGTPTDGTWTDGAYLGFTDTDKVVDILDELNESLENVRNNTFVRSVSFTGAPLSGGQGTAVTLNLTVDGNSNRYDIDWGDGSNTNGTADSTPSHTYTSNANSPFTVIVRAYHNSATVGSAGSEASATQTNYIIIYTADPVPAYGLFRDVATGTALTGNNFYVIQGDSLYLDNNTTNTLMADVTYSVDWGDGSVDDSIANDAATGGVTGARLQHTWGAGTSTGTSRDNVTLTLTTHTTADPAVIPVNIVTQLKVYDPNIATPDGLNTKTIAFANDEGLSPKLASGATDLTGSSSLTAGNDVDLTNNTTGQLETTVISTYAYDANNGTLEAKINGLVAGTKTLTGGDDSGTYVFLTITDEEDYNLLNAGGSATSFNSSIYHPGLYSGFKAKLSVQANVVSKGINSFQLSHSTTGDTNTVEFVKDDITSVPTVTAGTVSENNAGTYRYISGIPYYNSGSPSLTLSGVTVDSFIGQAYRNTSSPVNVTNGTNLEGTSQSSIGNQNYTYAQIDGITSFLTGGIPNADTGNGTPYTLGDLTVNITGSNVRTVENIRHRANNIYGSSSYQTPSANIQVHKSAQSGISEIAVAVSDALGATYNDDAVRVFDFSADTTNNPTIPGATNFYTNSVYTEATDPGVVGTKEATIRLGVLEHNVNNYSTGYLPVGPDRSADTGTQYITIAFRRSVVANFNINITSGTGVSGVWIAAPGTTIDNASTINGWLECGTQYGGAGVPGANTGNGGNGSNGCASTGGDIIASNTALSGSYTMTLGTENLTNATNNVALVRIALAANQNVTSLSIT